MQYLRAYKYVFDSPKWVNNVLFCTLCVLTTTVIPVLGGLIVLGYLFEVLESMHRRKRDQEYPDFTFDRFKEYFLRGLWPFLVRFVFFLPLGLVLGAGYVLMFVLVALADGQSAGIIIPIFYLFLIVVLVVLGVAVGVVLMPAELRAGLQQDFVPAFSVEFIKDFLKRVWKEALLAQLFLMASAWVLGMIGFLFCCIGIFPVSALIYFAQFHLLYQVYELYLERGGTPIPLKEPSVPDARIAPEESAAPEPPANAPDTTFMEANAPREASGSPEPPDAKTAPFAAPEPPPPPPPLDLPPTLPPP